MKSQILLLAIPLLFSCANKRQEEKDPTIRHHSYEEVSDKVVKWLDIFNKDNCYCVYFFSRTCKFCDSIRDEVIEKALTCKTKIYFCNDNNIVTDKYLDVESTINTGNIDEFRIKGFPSIIMVNNQLVNAHCPGKSATIDFVRSLA